MFPDLVARWLSIDKLECYAVLMNTSVFGSRVANHMMYDDCDNAGVVWALDSGSPHDPVLQEMVMHRHDLKSQFSIETSARHFPGWLNVCTDHLSRDRLEDFLHEAERRGFPHPEELPVDEGLKAFARSLAEMVRDHQTVSDTFMSRDSESVLNNLASEVSGDGPPGLREFRAPPARQSQVFLWRLRLQRDPAGTRNLLFLCDGTSGEIPSPWGGRGTPQFFIFGLLTMTCPVMF